MNLDEKIHFVLDKLNGSGPAELDRYIPEWLATVNETADNLEIHLIKYALGYEEFIVLDNKTVNHIITHNGRVVNESGGWKAFILSKKNKVDVENKTAQNNLHISDFQIKTQWWPHRLSILAVIISVLSLGVSVRQCQQAQSPESGTAPATQDEHSRSATQPTADTLKSDLADTLKKN